jgi:23S rRNA pseudouridine2605 synthase
MKGARGKAGGLPACDDTVSAPAVPPHGAGGSVAASGQRLQKVLARAGVASRRHAEEMIRDGRVRVAGRVVTTQGVVVDPAREVIEVDGRPIAAEALAYILFHKPRGVVSTMQDPAGRPSVAEYLSGVGARVVPVGRLDFQTSGVLLLTNDGDFARSLLHPTRGVLKEYQLKVQGSVDEAGLARFRESIEIDGRRTRPAQVEIQRIERDKTWLEVVLHEGKNRQIRRLAEHAGYRVMRLLRSRFAGLSVDGLAAGEWRHLTRAELRSLGVTR